MADTAAAGQLRAARGRPAKATVITPASPGLHHTRTARRLAQRGRDIFRTSSERHLTHGVCFAASALQRRVPDTRCTRAGVLLLQATFGLSLLYVAGVPPVCAMKGRQGAIRKARRAAWSWLHFKFKSAGPGRSHTPRACPALERVCTCAHRFCSCRCRGGIAARCCKLYNPFVCGPGRPRRQHARTQTQTRTRDTELLCQHS